MRPRGERIRGKWINVPKCLVTKSCWKQCSRIHSKETQAIVIYYYITCFDKNNVYKDVSLPWLLHFARSLSAFFIRIFNQNFTIPLLCNYLSAICLIANSRELFRRFSIRLEKLVDRFESTRSLLFVLYYLRNLFAFAFYGGISQRRQLAWKIKRRGGTLTRSWKKRKEKTRTMARWIISISWIDFPPDDYAFSTRPNI